MKVMGKFLTVLLVSVLILTAVSCDGDKTLPEEITISVWDGTSADTSWYSEDVTEFTLTEASQLAGLAKLVNEAEGTEQEKIVNSFSGKTIKLANNIDLNGKNWTPIGLYDKADEEGGDVEVRKLFSGTFDGQGHVITGLYFKNEKCDTVALFGYVDGTVKNIIVKGDITAKSAAGVVGALERNGAIENVTSYVNISATEKAAGIVMATKDKKVSTTGEWTIKDCKNYGNMTSGTTAGGILSWGDMYKTTITNCENHGEIVSNGSEVNVYAGGIVGMGKTLVIKNCANDKIVKAEKGAAGGIVGRVGDKTNESTCSVESSTNSGTATGCTGSETIDSTTVSYTKAGEIIGCVESADPDTFITITNCTIADGKNSVGAVFKYNSSDSWKLVSIESWPKKSST